MTTPGTVRWAGRAGGARPAFSVYVRERRPVLLRTARSMTSDPCDAEDLLQTALASTYLAWDRIADHRAVDGYVRRTLLNTRTSLWRKHRLDEYVCAELPESAHRPTPDPADSVPLRDAVWRAVLELPERQRATVVLRFYEDLSEADTAAVLGVSAGTVKSTVSRALAKLRTDPRLVSAAGGRARSAGAVNPPPGVLSHTRTS